MGTIPGRDEARAVPITGPAQYTAWFLMLSPLTTTAGVKERAGVVDARVATAHGAALHHLSLYIVPPSPEEAVWAVFLHSKVTVWYGERKIYVYACR